MQDDNKGLMPEFYNFKERITDVVSDVPTTPESDYRRGYVDGLHRAVELAAESFKWSSNGGTSGYVNSLDYGQLCYLIDAAKAIKAKKDEEEKLWVHRVVTFLGYTENFRYYQLQEAIDFYHKELQSVAAKEPGDIAALREVRLSHERVMASEYEDYFAK